jgi:hypothetical protein
MNISTKTIKQKTNTHSEESNAVVKNVMGKGKKERDPD